ncbi:unnamed protein product, partial [Phaeothamnion confervicola]
SPSVPFPLTLSRISKSSSTKDPVFYAVMLLEHLLQAVAVPSLYFSSREIPPLQPRRHALSRRDVVAVGVIVAGIAAGAPAARAGGLGAAELDAQYYLKSLFGSNQPWPAEPPVAAPARRLDPATASALLDIAARRTASAAGMPMAVFEPLIVKVRAAVEPAFQRKAAFPDDPADQYCFDMLSYATYKAAAEVLPDTRKRAGLVRMIGEDALEVFAPGIGREGGREQQAVPVVNVKAAGSSGPAAAAAGVTALLRRMQAVGLIGSFTWNEELEIDGWEDGVPLSAELVVSAPATLGAAVQAAGEGRRFHADFVGPALQAYWRRCGVRTAYEEYFLDDTYRPDPSQYRAVQVIYSWTLEPAGGY